MHSSEKDKVDNGNTSEMVIFNYPCRTKVRIKNTRKLVWSNRYKLTLLIGKRGYKWKIVGFNHKHILKITISKLLFNIMIKH